MTQGCQTVFPKSQEGSLWAGLLTLCEQRVSWHLSKGSSQLPRPLGPEHTAVHLPSSRRGIGTLFEPIFEAPWVPSSGQRIGILQPTQA